MKVILCGVPLYISLNHLGFFFPKFVEVASVSAVKSKAGIASEDVEGMVTVSQKKFVAIPNVLKCEGRPIYVNDLYVGPVGLLVIYPKCALGRGQNHNLNKQLARKALTQVQK